MKNISLLFFILFLLKGSITYSQTNVVPATGNTGIGTLSPSSLLEVVGTVSLTGTTGARSLSLNSGYVFNYNSNLFLHTTGGSNDGLFLGELAGLNAGSIVGVTNNGCVGIGYNALNAMARGNHNTAVGWNSLLNLHGTSTTAPGDKNTVMGSRAGQFISTGSENVGIGWNVFYQNTSTANAIIGTGNIGIGSAFTEITTGASAGVLGSLTSGNYNTVVGQASGITINSGSNNLILGNSAGAALSLGSDNIIIGNSTGSTLIDGQDNILIGVGVNTTATDANTQLNIGNTIYGDLATDEISIGSDLTPSMFNVGTTNQFQVNNNGRINNYNGIATVNNGVPSQVAVVNLANQSATIPASTVLYTSAAEGFYRVSYSGVITTAASYSSGAPASSSLSLRVKYNDPNLASDVVVPPTNLEPMNSYSTNAVGGNFSGSMLIYVEAGSPITFKATYASDPAAPATAPDVNMAYTLRIVLEKL